MKLKVVAGVALLAAAAGAATFWLGPFRSAPVQGEVAEEPEEEGLPVAEAGPFPKAVAPELEFEFGVMSPMTEKSHVFVIKNEGEGPLKLKQGRTDCKCTLSELHKESIAPGEEVKVTLKWSPVVSAMVFRQSATIFTNDPEKRAINFVVKGRVEPIIQTNPKDRWDVGQIPLDQNVVVHAEVASTMIDKFEVVEIKSDGPKVTATTEPLDPASSLVPKAKSAFKVIVTVPPDVPLGPFREELSIKLNTGDQADGVTTLKMPVTGFKSGPFNILPPKGAKWYPDRMRIDIGTFLAADGKTITLPIFVDIAEGEKLELIDVKSDYTSLKVKLDPDPTLQETKRKGFKLTFEIPPASPTATHVGATAAKVVLHTTHPRAGEVTFQLAFVSH